MNEAEQQAFAAQLACPHGELALAVGERMNEVNQLIVEHSIAALAPLEGETIVEIGPGNGVLTAPLVRALGSAGCFIGLERSLAMMNEAAEFLSRCDGAGLELHNCDALAANLPGGSVDGVLAVNVLYFVEDLEKLCRRLHYWLRPGGRAVFGLRSEAALHALPFARHGFRIRPLTEIVDTLACGGFTAVDTALHSDAGPGGDFVIVRARSL